MSGTVLTNKGLALITKLVAASTELQISRVAVGTGRVPSGVDPQTMVDLNEYKMDAQIESYGVSPDQSDVAYIAAQVSSIGVSAGFAVTEAGVFATDPDVGEILYAYLDLTEDPQYIYAETDAISKFAEITFNVLIGSVTKVTAYVSPGALTKKVDFNAFKESVETPEFDDSGTVEGISSFPSFLETMKSKMNFFQFFRNLKAGLQFVLHAGQIVNNCVTDNAGLPLSAAQGKVLKDLYTQLYSELDSKIYGIPNKNIADLLDLSAPDGLYRVDPAAKNNPVGTYGICEVRTTDDKGWRFVTFYATSPANIVRRNFYNSYGTTNPVWSGWLADGLPIDFTDINIELSPEQWATSNNGLKYYNHTGWNIPSNALGVCANIMNWHGTSGNVTCSVYDNSYLQLRCEDAISWGGIIRVFYINSYIM